MLSARESIYGSKNSIYGGLSNFQEGIMKKVVAALAAFLVLMGGTLSAQNTTLTVWDFKYGGKDAAALVLKDLDTLFEASHLGVKINHVGQPGDTYYQLIQGAATANTGPDVVMFHPDGRMQQFASLLYTLDKDTADVKSQFVPSSLIATSSPAQAGGSLKLLPFSMQGFGIYYNKDLFKKAGLDPAKAPKSEAEFLAACAKLKAAGIVPIVTGKDYTIDFFLRVLVANIAGPNYGDMVTSDAVFATPEFKKAATFVKTLVDKGYVEKAGLTRPYFMDAIDSFAAGSGAMFVGLLSDVGNWKRFSDTLGINKVGYFPNVNLEGSKYKDQQSAQPAGIGWGIFSWTKQTKLALEYIKFVSTGTGAARSAAAAGTISPNMMIDTSKIPYPVLPTIIGYMKTNFSEDFLQFGQANLENDMIRLDDQYFVTGQITVDQYVSGIQKSFHAK
jgi:ABC-type glycerol-3-phosphate transport system substrate-binding protein